MKKLFMISTFLFCFNLFGNCYADQYIQNLHSQMIRHLETQGYQFTNIGDGWHTVKPMETICATADVPPNQEAITVTSHMQGVFRLEYAYLYKLFFDNKYIETRGFGGQWVYLDTRDASDGGGWSVGRGGITNNFTVCMQNISRHASMNFRFDVSPQSLNNTH
jgi:hypothetical protein